MYIDRYRKSRGKIYRIAAWLCLTVVVLASCYFGYYKYWESKLQPPEGFSVEVSTKDLTVVGSKWLEAYTEQYRGFVLWNQKLIEYSINDIEIKEPNVIQIDFSIVTKKLDEKDAYKWNLYSNKATKACWI
jgi:hypothetical protein